MTKTYRIDVHHHLVPPFWAEALSSHGGDPSGWPTPKWSVEADLALMDTLDIGKALLSLTAPGVVGWQGPSMIEMARRVNDYTAGIVQRHPERFGNFATLPIGSLDSTLAEMEYALDTLGAEGVVLLSNYDGVYLGDPRFEQVWQELDRRGAVVFLHPTMPKIDLIPGVPGPLLDYPFDTTRTAMSMLANGTMTRFTNVKVILSHAGGFLPYGAYRFASGIAALQPDRTAVSVVDEMKRFYFDTALSSSPSALPCLLEFAKPGHVLFGSDIPYLKEAGVKWFTRKLDDHPGLAADQLNAINRNNAEALWLDAIVGT